MLWNAANVYKNHFTTFKKLHYLSKWKPYSITAGILPSFDYIFPILPIIPLSKSNMIFQYYISLILILSLLS